MSRITNILERIENYYTMKYGMDYEENEKPMSITEAEQALLALFNEAIGEDEPNVTSLLDNDTAPYIDNPVAIARNQLRAEIRERLGL